MSQSLYKNLLKRSRSSIDDVTDGEDFLQRLTPATLFVTENDAAREVSSLFVHKCIPNRLSGSAFFSCDKIRAVGLARCPSYPFDSSKGMLRWLLADQEDERRHSEGATDSRHRKYVVVDAANIIERPMSSKFQCTFSHRDKHADLLKDRSSPESDSVQNSLMCSFPQVSSGCRTLPGIESRLRSSKEENLEDKGLSAKDTGLLCLNQVSSRSFRGSNSRVEPFVVPLKRAGCVSRGRCPQFGLLSVCGRRREMEDTYRVEPDLVLLPCDAMGGCTCPDHSTCALSSFHFFGVYDGHGGSQASSFCKARLHKVLTEELIKDVRSCKKSVSCVPGEWMARWRRVMEASFLKIDEEVGGVCPTGGCSGAEENPSCCVNPIAPDNVGSTAVVAIIGPCQIIVGNCGDSRAVLSRGGQVIPLSNDHKPDRADEMNRIVAAGGRIIHWDGYRVGGLLAMSRAIGDRFLKQYVISLPEVTCIERSKEDECIILASDGLWDVVSSAMACDFARRCLRSQRKNCAKSDNPGAEDTPAGVAASLLIKVALSRGSKDNISVIVIDLKSHCKKLL